MAGEIELRLDAVSSAPDLTWILCLQDVYPAGKVSDVTQSFRRAGLRGVDDAAYRFKAGHMVRLFMTNDDQGKDEPAMLGFRHDGIGLNCISDILASSRLLLPLLPT